MSYVRGNLYWHRDTLVVAGFVDHDFGGSGQMLWLIHKGLEEWYPGSDAWSAVVPGDVISPGDPVLWKLEQQVGNYRWSAISIDKKDDTIIYLDLSGMIWRMVKTAHRESFQEKPDPPGPPLEVSMVEYRPCKICGADRTRPGFLTFDLKDHPICSECLTSKMRAVKPLGCTWCGSGEYIPTHQYYQVWSGSDSVRYGLCTYCWNTFRSNFFNSTRR